jgi:hypothetical protein
MRKSIPFGGIALLLPGLLSAQPKPAPPTAGWIYVGAESADLIHRIRLGPDTLVVERTIPIGELAAEMEGPHGADGRFFVVQSAPEETASQLNLIANVARLLKAKASRPD